MTPTDTPLEVDRPVERGHLEGPGAVGRRELADQFRVAEGPADFRNMLISAFLGDVGGE